MNIEMHVFILINVSGFIGYIARSRMAESHGGFFFNSDIIIDNMLEI